MTKIIDFADDCNVFAMEGVRKTQSLKSNEDPENDSFDDADGSGTFLSATLNLINTMIGAGMIGFPRSFGLVGIVQGLCLGAVFVCLSSMSLHFVICVGRALGGRKTSFFQACQVYFPKGKMLVDVAIFIQCFGSAISYVILVGKVISQILGEYGESVFPEWSKHRLLWSAAIMCFIMYPLALKKSLASLKYASMFAVLLIMYITCLIIACGVMAILPQNRQRSEADKIIIWDADNWRGILKYLGCMLFAFTCHQNMFKIYNELGSRYRSVKTSSSIAFLATLFAGVIYFMVGSFGYLAMGPEARTKDADKLFDELSGKTGFGEILGEGDPNFISVLIGRLGLVLIVTTCFPMQLHPARDSLKRLISFVFSMDDDDDDDHDEPNSDDQVTLSSVDITAKKEETDAGSANVDKSNICLIIRKRLDFFLTTLICLLAFAVCCATDQISIVLEIVGATGCNMIGFLFPAIFYLSLTSGSRKGYSTSFWKNPALWKRLMAIFIAVLGTLIMIGIIAIVIMDMVQ